MLTAHFIQVALELPVIIPIWWWGPHTVLASPNTEYYLLSSRLSSSGNNGAISLFIREILGNFAQWPASHKDKS